MSSKVSSVNEAKAPAKGLFDSYTVTMEFSDQLMGGVPKHPDMIKSWLNARAPTHAPPDGTPLPELAVAVAEEVNATEEDENKAWTGFKSDDAGILYVDGYHLKAHLKDQANVIKDYLGVKAFKSKVADRLFVEQSTLCLVNGTGFVYEPTGHWEHAVHILTPQGPRSALKRNDYVRKPTIHATLLVLTKDSFVTEERIRALFEYGSVKGFGAERGLGHGRYTFTLEKQS